MHNETEYDRTIQEKVKTCYQLIQRISQHRLAGKMLDSAIAFLRGVADYKPKGRRGFTRGRDRTDA